MESNEEHEKEDARRSNYEYSDDNDDQSSVDPAITDTTEIDNFEQLSNETYDFVEVIPDKEVATNITATSDEQNKTVQMGIIVEKKVTESSTTKPPKPIIIPQKSNVVLTKFRTPTGLTIVQKSNKTFSIGNTTVTRDQAVVSKNTPVLTTSVTSSTIPKMPANALPIVSSDIKPIVVSKKVQEPQKPNKIDEQTEIQSKSISDCSSDTKETIMPPTTATPTATTTTTTAQSTNNANQSNYTIPPPGSVILVHPVNSKNTSSTTTYPLLAKNQSFLISNKMLQAGMLKKPTQMNKLPVLQGFKQIPKETVIKQIFTKDIQANKNIIDAKRFILPKPDNKVLCFNPPSISITQKPLSSVSTSSIPFTTTQQSPTLTLAKDLMAKHRQQSEEKNASFFTQLKNLEIGLNKPNQLKISNKSHITNGNATNTLNRFPVRIIEKGEKQKLEDSTKSEISILNGSLSNPNGPIKLLNSMSTTTTTADSVQLKSKFLHLTQPNGVLVKVPQPDKSDAVTIPTSPNPTKSTAMKNKLLEQMQKSPRLSGRSRSLNIGSTTVSIQKKRNPRRIRIPSAPTESPTKPEPTIIKTPSKLRTTNDDPISPMDNHLECTEKLSESDVQCKSPIPIKIESITRSAGGVSDLPPHHAIQNIKWNKCIGYLSFSKVHFKMNEFGCVEIFDNRDLTQFGGVDSTFLTHINKQTVEMMNKEKEEMAASTVPCKVCSKLSRNDMCSVECYSQWNEMNAAGPSGAGINSTSLLKSRLAKANPVTTFVWEQYLKGCGGRAAPVNLFINPYPSSTNLFEVNMKLEAIDPEHCSLFCVCTIVEKSGYRIKLSFDGYKARYDFWKNADSMDIFPPGWCSKTGRKLEPPGNYGQKFEWSSYLFKTKSLAAPRNLFTHLNSSASADNPFKVHMKLEADDLKNSRKVCVATVGDVLDNRILIRFDGWDESYDYWTDITSPYIHPINWHKQNGFSITAPPDYNHKFNWSTYLMLTRSRAAPDNFFCARNPIGFKPGMKLEIVDKKNPRIIRPASVIAVDDYEIKILFDNWPSNYAYWIDDDNTDIHPVQWCAKTGHFLDPPPKYLPNRYKSACGVVGCREIGNARNVESQIHYTLNECPYETRNWNNEDSMKTKRLEDIAKKPAPKVDNRRKRQYISGGSLSTLQQLHVSKKRMKKEFESQQAMEDISSSISFDNIGDFCSVTIKEEKCDTENVYNTPDQAQSIEMEKRLKISANLLSDYGPSVHQIHRLWKENCAPLNISTNITNPLNWSCNDVANYVSQLPNCLNCAEPFREHEIDGFAFLQLRQNDLTDLLNFRLGPAVKIFNQIICLREEVNIKFID